MPPKTERSGPMKRLATLLVFLAAAGTGARAAEPEALRLVQTISLPEVEGRIDLSGDADNVRYDPADGAVYVGHGDGAIGIVDAASGRRLGDIALAGHPEAFQLERGGPRLFVNVPAAGQVAVVDRAVRSVTATWPVT